MTELTQDEIDQVHGGGFFSKFGRFLGFCLVTLFAKGAGFPKAF
ncbi:hypothetical protein [Roseateles chitosanitabidus]|jgi:hypothetical protein|nr:hypothetical protein [Roseateles chitosanitabidus]